MADGSISTSPPIGGLGIEAGEGVPLPRTRIRAHTRSVGVQGAAPPADLDTLRKKSGSVLHNRVFSQRGQGDRGQPLPPYQPVRESWRSWTHAVADCLDAKGASKSARLLRWCGSKTTTIDCDHCGVVDAHAEVKIGCGLRICAFCQRKATKAKQATLLKKCRSAQNGDKRYGWRNITIGLKYDKYNRDEYSVSGLIRRIGEVKAQWAKIWPHVAFKGQASAIFRVEISENGFVHAHVLYYGPFLNVNWLNKIIKRECRGRVGLVTIGSLQKRKRALQHALKESVKYVTKAPSPLSGRWISGKTRKVIHPELAANWLIATANRHMSQLYGQIRSKADSEEQSAQRSDLLRCPHCSYPMFTPFARVESTVDVCRRMRATNAWRDVVLRTVV